jgi:pimeloyl-ACP methyl ester carboxylesterase
MPANFVFLHGGGQGGWVWAETIAALRTEARASLGLTLVLDAPGCGVKRGRDTSALSLQDVASELLEDITRATRDPVVLVGHSQAGQAMSLMQGARPDLFQRLIYVSCSIPLPGQTSMQLMGNSLHGTNPAEVGWPVDPATTSVEQRFSLMFCNDMDANQKAAFLARLGQDQWPKSSYTYSQWRYDRLNQTPATFIVCLRDLSLPADWQEVFADRFQAKRRVTIDAGHQVMNTRPRELANILLAEAAMN